MSGPLILERVAGWRRSPMFWILCAALISRLPGLTWGLPASDGWDDDGVAPRNFLVGLAQTYAPGSYFTYPPLHMIFLAILTLPGWLLALARAPELTPHAVIGEFIHVPYMTVFAVIARAVGAVMSLGTIFLIGKMTETIAGLRAGMCAAAVCALNATLIYYGQVTNLDGPYLFWAALSLWGWMRVIADHELRHMRWTALAAAAAVATKDQAYAIFLVSVPVSLALWFALDPRARRNTRKIVLSLLFATGIATIALLTIDGALFNPAGFVKRIAFLIGPASQDYAQYDGGWQGRMSLLKDSWEYFPRFYPRAAGLLGVLGVIVRLVRSSLQRSRLVAGLVPLLAILSFTTAFNFVALRSENRFLLPQTVFVAVYIGIFIDKFAFARAAQIRYPARVVFVALAGLALYRCAAIDAAFIDDPRYDAEQWLDQNVHPGDAIEAYGLNVFLPRFPSGALVTRLDRKPLARRNPLPSVTESDQPFEDVASRNPRFLVVSGFWVQDYLADPPATQQGGRITQKVRLQAAENAGASAYFRALFAGRLTYRLAHRSAYDPGIWPNVNGFESLAQPVFLFERVSSSP